jgi:hypothetical protein
MSNGIKDKIGGVGTTWKSDGLIVIAQDSIIINL